MRIVVGIGGGIAAFKTVELVRELTRRGAEVRVVMTHAATQFVGSVTFAGITGHPAVTDLWDPEYAGEVHVELSEFADAMIIAPATANLIARSAHGMADDAVLATLACFAGPVFMAPAMHERMWNRPATQTNVRALESQGVKFVGPEHGPLASGDTGKGRMSEPSAIADAVMATEESSQADMRGWRVLVTAGPTREHIDPVRYLSNRSSGRMGIAVAEVAAKRGATVTLVHGPVSAALPSHAAIECVAVESAVDMHREVNARIERCQAIVMAAAVADYRPIKLAEQKLKKTDGPMTIELERNPDILLGLGQSRKPGGPTLVGFALESEDLLKNARDKLDRKHCDLVVANSAAGAFGGDENEAYLVSQSGEEHVPRTSKTDLAHRIWDTVVRTRP